MAVLVATSDGYHVFTSSGDHHTNLAGHSVDALAPGPADTWVAVVDGTEVWQHTADGTWSTLALADVTLTAIHLHRDAIVVGTHGAHLLRLDGDVLVPVPTFDSVSGHDEWHAVGPALHVRSMTTTADGSALLANVHVGGIPRSTDGGITWAPTIRVDDDVHEVRAHPSEPARVAAAAAVGLCESNDGGSTWTTVGDGLTSTYARAVAFTDDAVLVSISEGPFAARSTVFRRALPDGALEPLRGLPDDGLTGNVDSGCLAGGRGRVALADGAGDVWIAADGSAGARWSRIASAVGQVHAVAVT